MANTIRANLPLLDTFQAQKEVTHNEALRILDVVMDLLLESRAVSTPPVSPQDGQAWLVSSPATGDWAGQEDKVAIYYDGWTFLDPFEGMRAWVDDENDFLIFVGSTWKSIPGAVVTPWRIPVQSVVSGTQIQITASGANSLTPVDEDGNDVALYLPELSDLEAGDVFIIKKVSGTDNLQRNYGYVRNALLYSNDQTQSSVYSYSRLTVNGDQGTDPDGGTTMDKLEETAETGVHEIDQQFEKPVGVTRVVGAVVLQADERTEAMVAIDLGSSSDRAEMRVDLTDGSITNTASSGVATYVPSESSVTALNNNNYLVIIAADVPAAQDTWEFRVRIYNGTSTYLGVVGEGLFMGRTQISYSSPFPEYSETTTTPDYDLVDGGEFIEQRSEGSTITLIADSSGWVVDKPEESLDNGEWTPSVSGTTTSGSQTYGNRSGIYVRRGKFIDFWIDVEVTTLDAATAGDLRITGLPFQAANVTGVSFPVSVTLIDGLTLTTNYTQLSGYLSNNSSVILFRESGSGQTAQNVDVANASSGLHLLVQGSVPIN